MTWMPATPMDEYAKGVQECRGALYVRPQGGDKLRPYERIFTAKSIKGSGLEIRLLPKKGKISIARIRGPF